MQNDNLKFKNVVFKVVQGISVGKVLTYKEVARLSGRPNAFRAVGNILNKNYNPDIPCHRVIKSNGSIGNYNKGVKKKIMLLKREGFFI